MSVLLTLNSAGGLPFTTVGCSIADEGCTRSALQLNSTIHTLSSRLPRNINAATHTLRMMELDALSNFDSARPELR